MYAVPDGRRDRTVDEEPGRRDADLEGGAGRGGHEPSLAPRRAAAAEEPEDDGEETEEETDADYRARTLHLDTLTRLTESMRRLRSQEFGADVDGGGLDASAAGALSLGIREILSPSAGTDSSRDSGRATAAGRGLVEMKTHSYLMYYGNRLEMSSETVTASVTAAVAERFVRVVRTFERMLLGTYTDLEVADLRRDHERLIAEWDEKLDGGSSATDALNVAGELSDMMRGVLSTPLYFAGSAMALIACGRMLQNLYSDADEADGGGNGEPAPTYDRLLSFVRSNMRHDPADPFSCDCADTGDRRPCSGDFKRLLSMIMEVPTISHNQTYLLQVLAYMMCGKSGREGVFVNSLKNVCSPGLLDRLPTRVALLMGTLDAGRLAGRYRSLRRLLGVKRSALDKRTLDRLVEEAHGGSKTAKLIDALPGAASAVVELRLPKCDGGGRTLCLNADRDGRAVMDRDRNNGGKSKCCGYLRQDAVDLLAPGVSLIQTMVYLYTDTTDGGGDRGPGPGCAGRRHFFVREVVLAMAKRMSRVRLATLEDLFGYMDRTHVFKNFNENPFMMGAVQELFASYLEHMDRDAEDRLGGPRGRRMKRYCERHGYRAAPPELYGRRRPKATDSVSPSRAPSPGQSDPAPGRTNGAD